MNAKQLLDALDSRRRLHARTLVNFPASETGHTPMRHGALGEIVDFMGGVFWIRHEDGREMGYIRDFFEVLEASPT